MCVLVLMWVLKRLGADFGAIVIPSQGRIQTAFVLDLTQLPFSLKYSSHEAFVHLDPIIPSISFSLVGSRLLFPGEKANQIQTTDLKSE